MKTIELSDSAMTILEDFIKYSTLYPGEMASVMYYDEAAFRIRIARLARDVDGAMKGEAL